MKRRDFLVSSAGFLLAACARSGAGSLLASRRRRVRYAISTQSMYWSSDQDFRAFGEIKKLDVRGLPLFHDNVDRKSTRLNSSHT